MSKLFVNTIAPNSGDTVTISGSLTTTGKLTIGDASTDTVAFSAEISSSLVPDVDDTYDLGTPSKQWRHLYIDGLAQIDTASIHTINATSGSFTKIHSSITPASNNKTLGTSANPWLSGSLQHLTVTNQFSSGFLKTAISASGRIHAYGVQADSGFTGSLSGTSSFATTASYAPSSSYAESSSYALTSSFAVTVANHAFTTIGELTASAARLGELKIVLQSSASSGDLANLGANYTVNGGKVLVKAITAGSIADGAFEKFQLLNNNIEATSVVVGNFVGNTAANSALSGSAFLTATVTSAKTASIFIHNETGAPLAADTGFTASFVIL